MIDEDLEINKDYQPTVERLKSEYNCISVFEEKKLTGKKDYELGKFANENGYTVVTGDKSSFLKDNLKKGQTLENGLVALRLYQLSPKKRAERTSNFLKANKQNLKNKSVILEPATERVNTIEQAKESRSNSNSAQRLFTNKELTIDRISDNKLRINLPNGETAFCTVKNEKDQNDLIKRLENPHFRKEFSKNVEQVEKGQKLVGKVKKEQLETKQTKTHTIQQEQEQQTKKQSY